MSKKAKGMVCILMLITFTSESARSFCLTPQITEHDEATKVDITKFLSQASDKVVLDKENGGTLPPGETRSPEWAAAEPASPVAKRLLSPQ
jgi:hypothetical protein